MRPNDVVAFLRARAEYIAQYGSGFGIDVKDTLGHYELMPKRTKERPQDSYILFALFHENWDLAVTQRVLYLLFCAEWINTEVVQPNARCVP